MRFAVASDHAGFQFKTMAAQYLRELGHDVVDFGTDSETPVDYPDFICPAALAVSRGECDRGLVFGGSGNGEAMAANRVPAVRCAVVWHEESARLSRRHNDSNMMSIGQRMVPEAALKPIIDVWLSTPFEGGRHVRRIDKMDRCP